MPLSVEMPLRKVKAIATVNGELVSVLECGHTQRINTDQDKSRQARRCYRCWREAPLPR